MRSFLHTVQKNQLLMMTPNSLGRTSVMKSFIKQSGKLDVKVTVNAEVTLVIKVFQQIICGFGHLIAANQIKVAVACFLSW